jgi:hypothetical protein
MDPSNIYFDCETLPLPPSEREASRPIPSAPPTRDTVKYGNTKDEAKREVIFTKALDKWEADELATLAAWQEGDKCALSAIEGRVACIGIARNDEPAVLLTGGPENDEATLLGEFWALMGDSIAHDLNRFIGYYSNHFDMPMLIRRSLILRVPVPSWVQNDISQYRPTVFVDLIDIWRCGDRQIHVKLAVLCGAFGIPVKEGPVEGKFFYKFWNGTQDQRLEAGNYCLLDVEATRELAKKLGVRL